MPFPMKIQPIDSHTPEESIPYEPVKPPAAKWRFRRLFERQFAGVLKISAAAAPEKPAAVEELHCSRDGSGEFEPSSVCLAKMVQNFIEDSNEKPAAAVRCGRSRCNCFNGNNCNGDSEDEFDGFSGFGDSNLLSSGEACEILKSLVPCATVAERNLLADAAKIVEKNKICKCKDDFCRMIVVDGLIAFGYDASICKSRWDKSPSYPAGEYEYVDAIVGKERLLIDIDFRSEFEIARPTKNYKAVLQILPHIFVGKPDRLQKIVSIVTEAAKQSLKKKGMHVPPWRRSDYVNAKWLSPYTRTSPHTRTSPPPQIPTAVESDLQSENRQKPPAIVSGEVQGMVPAEEAEASDDHGDGECLFSLFESSGEEWSPAMKQWELPAVKPKSAPTGVKMVTGLASVIRGKP